MKKLILTLPLLLSGCTSYYNLSGANKDKAEAEARTFAESLGMDLKGVQCNQHDTDGDGYVSCTFNLGDGQVQTFECAGKSAIQDNTGCREPKIKVPRAIQTVRE